MDARKVHPVEYAILGLLIGLNFGVGLYFSFVKTGPRKTTYEVFFASRTIHIFPLAVSMLASVMSGSGVIGFVAHYYAYGLHNVWTELTLIIILPIIVCVFIPVVYNLRVTSVFQYLRMRYGNEVGLTACIIYFVLSQILGAVALYTAATAVSTIFRLSLVGCSFVIGMTGTIYTSLGGLRGVVWTDCLQAVLMLASPLTVIGKVIYDANHKSLNLRPMSDFDIRPYMLEYSFDLTKEENVWAFLFGMMTMMLTRTGMDQMMVQRFLAARTLVEAQMVAIVGILLVIFGYTVLCFMGLALIFWYRDCDPVESGKIDGFDKIVPYYVNENFAEFTGLRGLFLTGIIGASTSTITSIINSQAAVLYVDVVSQYFKLTEQLALRTVQLLALTSGVIMTLFGILVPHLGSAARIILVLYVGLSGPFVGIVILALVFPWANAKGTATAALICTVLQMWHSIGKSLSGIEPPRMAVTIDRCPPNTTSIINTNDSFPPTPETFLLYRLSSYWISFLGATMTIFLGLVFSVATGTDKIQN
ncbi:putative sodium-dependent multivitamin transporter [Ixodes scapularis]